MRIVICFFIAIIFLFSCTKRVDCVIDIPSKREIGKEFTWMASGIVGDTTCYGRASEWNDRLLDGGAGGRKDFCDWYSSLELPDSLSSCGIDSIHVYFFPMNNPMCIICKDGTDRGYPIPN